ncbi:hypothetical protein LXL04_020147 [Taraxacum kok-saghyz]
MRGTMQGEGTRCVIYSVQFVSCSPGLTTTVLQMLATCSCRRIAALVGNGLSSAQPLIVTNQLRFLQIPNSEQTPTPSSYCENCLILFCWDMKTIEQTRPYLSTPRKGPFTPLGAIHAISNANYPLVWLFTPLRKPMTPLPSVRPHTPSVPPHRWSSSNYAVKRFTSPVIG